MTYTIRPYVMDDAAQLFEAATESIDTVYRWLPWCRPGYTLDEARAWVAEQTAAFEEGKEYEFVIVSPSGRFAGGCGIDLIDRTNRRANLGYWVRSSEAGRGAATDAARLAASWAFETLKLIRIEILAAAGNVQSQRVAEKAGAIREGTLRQRLLLHGVAHDAAIFSIVRTLPV
ncbi:MAG TPA: GNAT family N-acetyltransferase [Thermoflexales bacterium]|nr:GNAT family N-acetyltransferase [Thermoflexales bacterium]HQY23572.1 GNAT family N-acetyltransferase [Thermoflexales bacterium]HRA53449.1 GNAT family N-acetyltransferase [Thermoflexales bacterium]